MSSDEIRNWATAYAALVATFSLIWNIITYLKNRPSLVVEGQYTFTRDEGDPEDAIRFDLTNPSPKKVTIVALGFKPKSAKGIITLARDAYFRSTLLPETLGESETFSVCVRLSGFLKVGAVGYISDDIEFLAARDSSGKLHRSRTLPLQADGHNRLNTFEKALIQARSVPGGVNHQTPD